MYTTTKYYSLLIVLLFFSMEAIGQFDSSRPDQFDDSQLSGTLPADTSSTESNSFFDIFTGKPGKAAFYSLIIPGGGQFYNKRYWKIPIIVGGEAFSFYWLFWNNSKYKEWNKGYLDMLNNRADDYRGLTNITTVKSVRDNFLKNREYAYIVVILAHLFNVFEAFIDRHLIDFDVSDDLSFKPFLNPTITGNPYAGITFTIPLQQRNKQKEVIDFFNVYK